MKLKALDTIRVSAAGGRKEQGEEFEIEDSQGKQLVERGLAEEVKSKAPPAAKAKPKAANKAAKAPKNKAR